jgi:ABC-2 type transport system ATP-binding protein
MPPAPLIEAEGLSRRHGGREVLRGVSFTLAPDQVLGLLGVNGAGKSTLLRILAGVLAPEAGRLRIAGAELGADPRAARTRIGWLPERAPLYPELTVAESLVFAARLRGLGGAAGRSAVERALERCALGEVRHRLCGNLSRGFAQRAGLAQAIVHEPPVLLLDEPTAGLDPLQAQRFHELLATLRPGRAIVLSSHQLAEVQAGCDLAAVLHAGVLDVPAPPGDGRALSQRFMALALGSAA